MNKAIAITLTSVILAAAMADASTWTWKGGDGEWFSDNWLEDGVEVTGNPGAAPAGDIEIDGTCSVTYTPGNDWAPSGMVRISGGASLTQVVGAAWPNLAGSQGALVLDNGTYDAGTAGEVRFHTLDASNGSAFLFSHYAWFNGDVALSYSTISTNAGLGAVNLLFQADVSIDSDSRIATSGTLTFNGTLRLGEGSVTAGAIARGADSTLILDGGSYTVSGNNTPKAVDQFNAGSFTLTGNAEFQPLDGLVNNGVDIVCWCFAPPAVDTVTTFNAGSLTLTRDSADAFYKRTGVYIDIPSGSTARFTLAEAAFAASSLYSYCFGGADPRFRVDGAAITEEEFGELFEVTSTTVTAPNGTVLAAKTFALLPEGAWKLGPFAAGNVTDNADPTLTKAVTLTFEAVKNTGTATAAVYLGWAESDLGETLAAWQNAGALETLAATLSSSYAFSVDKAFAPGAYFARAFLVFTEDGETTTLVSAPVSIVARAHEYGGLTDVYEYVGTDNNLSAGANWEHTANGETTTGTAPVAGTDVRWFGAGSSYSAGTFAAYATDRFAGTAIAATGDFDVHGDLLFSNSTIRAGMFVLRDGQFQFSLFGSTMEATRTDAGWYGLYFGDNYAAFNFISGRAASFTGKAPAGFTASDIYERHVASANPYILLDGAAIAEETWREHFTVEMLVDGRVTVSYAPTVADNRIDEITVAATSSSAALSAEIGSIESGAVVRFAIAEGETPPAEAALLAQGATEVAVADGVATVQETGLSELAVYSFRFGIVADGEVKATKTGFFVASDFAHVYMNGGWIGGTPAVNTAVPALFLDDFNALNGDLNVAGKVVKGVSIRSGTLVGVGPLLAYSAQVLNTRANDYANCPFGYWQVTAPLIDFRTLSGGGTIRAASSYSFYTTRADADIYAALFDANAPMILVNGAAANQADFTLTENSTSTPEEDVTLRNVTLAYWEPFPAGATGDWILENGARVKLAGRTRLGALTVANGADAKIDLNGSTLRVSSLTVGGVALKGVFTSTTLPSLLVGEGTLEVAKEATLFSLR